VNVARELNLLKEMAADLSDYLLSDVLYWQMAGSGDLPKLSLGMLLLTRARLSAVADQLDSKQTNRLDETLRQIGATHERWRSTAEKKADQELHSRATLWQRYWDECRHEPSSCASSYPHEVTNRVIAQLLLREFPSLAKSANAMLLQPTDRAVRGRLQGEQPVWPPELQPAFPKTEFPYLYGAL
jgi:hypothetical protein